MSPEPQRPANRGSPGGNNETWSEEEYAEEARLFYEQLEQTGQLIDVDPDTDIATLPPHITHVRYPDGTVKRIGFNEPPYGV
jgi:hypothetical protein